MKIKFKKKRLYTLLIGGIVLIGLGIFSLIEGDKLHLIDYGYFVVGILSIGHYLYDLTNQYLLIENGIIKRNGLYGIGKKIKLNDINSIKKSAGDYILKTEQKELKINTKLIEENSLVELNKILKELNLPSEKTPFANNL